MSKETEERKFLKEKGYSDQCFKEDEMLNINYVQALLKTYASQKCKEQRDICADEILDEPEDKKLQKLVDIVRVFVLEAPSPTDKKKEKEETTSGSPTDRA